MYILYHVGKNVKLLLCLQLDLLVSLYIFLVSYSNTWVDVYHVHSTKKLLRLTYGRSMQVQTTIML